MAFGPDKRFAARAQGMSRAQADAAEIDVGLRQYMLRVYNYMALGVALTGIVSMVVAMNPDIMVAIVGGPMLWVFFIGILGMGFLAPRVMMTGSVTAGQACFWVYAAMWGALIAPYFYMYTQDSIARVFFITSAAFAGLSLYGYTTKKDLTAMGRFLTMAVFGIIIAVVVNIFLGSAAIHTLLSIVIVLAFAGLTAYQTQAIKNMYYEADSGGVTSRKAIFGAFVLYGSFITMFIWLLHLFGVARD